MLALAQSIPVGRNRVLLACVIWFFMFVHTELNSSHLQLSQLIDSINQLPRRTLVRRCQIFRPLQTLSPAAARVRPSPSCCSLTFRSNRPSAEGWRNLLMLVTFELQALFQFWSALLPKSFDLAPSTQCPGASNHHSPLPVFSVAWESSKVPHRFEPSPNFDRVPLCNSNSHCRPGSSALWKSPSETWLNPPPQFGSNRESIKQKATLPESLNNY